MPNTCFVIQPFDTGKYDKLYEDVFSPAISAAGLKPYRVDRDPNVSIPIDSIEEEIANASLCVAEISSDNPNVWFELGYAIAKSKPIVMVCVEGRGKYPFDIQHRSIISYKTESSRDFHKLQEDITSRAKAVIERENKQIKLLERQIVQPTAGLEPHEVTCLATIAIQADGLNGTVSHFTVQSQMEKAGYNGLAAKLALRRLVSESRIQMTTEQEWASNDTYEAYRLTDDGWEWILANQGNLELVTPPRRKSPPFDTDSGDDIPF